MGGPLRWVRLHHVRDYWQNESSCPPYFSYKHSLLTEFWWNLHGRYELKGSREEANVDESPDIAWLRFLGWSWPLHNLLLGAALYAIDGWGMVLVAGCLRTSAGILGHCYHVYPASARMGQAWYEFDLGWYALRSLEAIGIVRNMSAFGRVDSGMKKETRPKLKE